jgi:hypothetical protein
VVYTVLLLSVFNLLFTTPCQSPDWWGVALYNGKNMKKKEVEITCNWCGGTGIIVYGAKVEIHKTLGIVIGVDYSNAGYEIPDRECDLCAGIGIRTIVKDVE